MPKKVNAVDSIKKLRAARYTFPMIQKLLAAREIYLSVAMLSRIGSDDPDQHREPTEAVRAELQTLALELG